MRLNHMCSVLTGVTQWQLEQRVTEQRENEKKERGEKLKNRKALRRRSPTFDSCARPSQNVVKRDASGKKGKLSCCKCIFDQIKGNLAEIQPQNHQNFQKTHFWWKAPGVDGLICFSLSKLSQNWLWNTALNSKCCQLWFTFSRQRRIWSFHVAVLQRTTKKCTKNYNACVHS